MAGVPVHLFAAQRFLQIGALSPLGNLLGLLFLLLSCFFLMGIAAVRSARFVKKLERLERMGCISYVLAAAVFVAALGLLSGVFFEAEGGGGGIMTLSAPAELEAVLAGC